jgi:hypothetical protein
VREKFFVLGRQEQPRQNKNLLYRHYKPNEPTKKRPLSFVLFESLFTSVSTVSRGQPSLVSLVFTFIFRKFIFPAVKLFKIFITKEGSEGCGQVVETKEFETMLIYNNG